MQSSERRSADAAKTSRTQIPWPKSKEFRILAIDGGGIRGIFPAAVLAGLEQKYLNGETIAEYFDLITGTSTGGIIALGLGAGISTKKILHLYLHRGNEIFPPHGKGFVGRFSRRLQRWRQFAYYSYDSVALKTVLEGEFGNRLFGSSTTRLCIPAFEGKYGEVFVFKTPHHPDFKKDYKNSYVAVALATSAAPTFFRPHHHNGYVLVDGGVWANNPVMVGVVEALTSFDVPRENIRVLSLGCGDDPYKVSGKKISLGGAIFWRDIIFAAMRLQSQSALGQARLLIGPEQITRLETDMAAGKIELDDWTRASAELPSAAEKVLAQFGTKVAATFLNHPANPYSPFYKAD